MANHLEQLIAEWYTYQGYFVWRNIKACARDRGGYHAEIDIIAFNPEIRKVVHIECSLDGESQSVRESRFGKKFRYGEIEIRKRLSSMEPFSIDKMIILLFTKRNKQEEIAGVKVVHIADVIKEIAEYFKAEKSNYKRLAVSEDMPVLRTLQLAVTFKNEL